MIYICEGVKQACLLPCTLCTLCSTVCKESCDACSAACKSCCGSFRTILSPVIDNELASYVIGTWMLFISTVCFAGAGAYYGMNGCSVNGKQAVLVANIMMIACGLIHAGFAIYVQRALVASINADENQGKSTADVTFQLLKYDIPFCVYVFIGYCGGICVCMYTLTLDWKSCSSETSFGVGGAIAMNLIFHFSCFWYFCCFVCKQVTKKGATSAKKTIKGADPSPAKGDVQV